VKVRLWKCGRFVLPSDLSEVLNTPPTRLRRPSSLSIMDVDVVVAFASCSSRSHGVWGWLTSSRITQVADSLVHLDLSGITSLEVPTTLPMVSWFTCAERVLPFDVQASPGLSPSPTHTRPRVRGSFSSGGVPCLRVPTCRVQGSLAVLGTAPNLQTADLSFCPAVVGDIKVFEHCPHIREVHPPLARGRPTAPQQHEGGGDRQVPHLPAKKKKKDMARRSEPLRATSRPIINIRISSLTDV
jgi:hypothetical protein